MHTHPQKTDAWAKVYHVAHTWCRVCWTATVTVSWQLLLLLLAVH
jgi:hypothetical protein